MALFCVIGFGHIRRKPISLKTIPSYANTKLEIETSLAGNLNLRRDRKKEHFVTGERNRVAVDKLKTLTLGWVRSERNPSGVAFLEGIEDFAAFFDKNSHLHYPRYLNAGKKCS